MKKKIIEVPEDCTHVGIFKGESRGYRFDVSDLPDYEEPRTADGLTLSEFLEKAKDDCSNVLYEGELSCRTDIHVLVYDVLLRGYDFSNYGIKPEKKYIPWTKETAPDWFEGEYRGDSREFILSFYSHKLGWGFMIEEEDYDLYFTFEELYHNFKQKDSTPCGQEVDA